MKAGTISPDSPPAEITGFRTPTEPLRNARWSEPNIVRIAYKSFDRQYLIIDSRVVDRPRQDLWRTVGPKQSLRHRAARSSYNGRAGPIVYMERTDAHHYNNRGGRVVPLYRDPQGIVSNVAPGLLRFLSDTLKHSISAEDLLAYIAAVVAHSGFTNMFRKDLETPGIRVPISRDPQLWEQAREIGREVIWLHTYGMCFADARIGHRA